MKKLNKIIAKELQEKYLGELISIEMRNFLFYHSEKMGKIANLLAKKFNINYDFEIASIVHDMGYFLDYDNHGQKSLDLLDGYEIDDILRDCILNHSNKSNPETFEGKIFQLADKMFIIDINFVDKIKIEDGKIINEDIKYLENIFEKILKIIK